MASAILPECAGIGFVAILGQFKHWLFLLLKRLQGCCGLIGHLDILIGYQFLHVDRYEEMLQIEFALTNIVAIQTDEICTSHVDTTLLQQPLLIGNIWGIFLEFGLLTIELREAAALHLIDSITTWCLAKDIHCAVMALNGEGCLADVLSTIGQTRLGFLDHRCNVERAILTLGGYFYKVTK